MNPNPSDIIELLDRQIEALGRMLAGLAAERRALETRDLDALNSAMDVKTECMAQLETLVGTFERPPGADDDAAIAERRHHVAELSEQCRELNAANGLLITGQHRFVSGALAALGLGSSAPATYGPDGVGRHSELVRKDRASA